MTNKLQLQFAAYSASHVGLTRSENQDAYGESETRYGYVYIVCDGMGGHAGGAEAARIAVHTILQYMRNEVQDSPVQALHEAILSANRMIHDRSISQPELRGMGSTCVVMLLTNDGQAFIAHVGDSRIYGWQNNSLFHLTKDHSFVQLMLDQGQITEEEAERHPNRNQILRALGIEDEVRPTITSSPIPLESGMRFLLCTDGLNGMIKDDEIAKSLKEGDFNQTLADILISQALNGGGKDNVTLTLIEIMSAPHSQVALAKFGVGPECKIDDDPPKGPKPEPKSKRVRLKYVLMTMPIILIFLYFFLALEGQRIGDDKPGDEVKDTTNVPGPIEYPGGSGGGISEDGDDGIPEDVGDDVPEDVGDDIPEDVGDDIPEDVGDDVREDVGDDVREDVGDDVPEGGGGDVPEDVGDDHPEDVGDDVPEGGGDDVPEDVGGDDSSEGEGDDIPEDVGSESKQTPKSSDHE